ncbi:MAG: hypothetical protein JST93_14385 [Acidobacteria bacterium]|nr:hypothetical protein [Acidobacteriota bacterium]
MRITIATLVVCLGAASAQSFAQTGFSEVNAEEAQALVGNNVNYDARAAMYIWADRISYQPGQALTLRMTMKSNDDPYPYTVVAYRQNNQDGVKTYLPKGTSEPTDIFGNGVEQGFRAVKLGSFAKAVMVGANGLLLNQALSVPNELGMHTIVVQLRDYTGTRIIKSAYFKFGVVSATEDLPSVISANRYLTNDKLYRINGIVQVRGGATLSIQPGTLLVGTPGSQPPSVLLITNTGRLDAIGTQARPIIMTSSQPIGSRQRGDWGGLIMLGKAIVNDPGGALNIEGLPDSPDTMYGGTNDDHDCGALRYLRVEFAGALLRPNEETNSFTWGACGKLTQSSYLQAHYGLDDAFEWFGGSNDAKYLVGTYTADDYLDFQIGYRGRVQHAIMVANADRSNRGIEGDNYERDFAATPASKPQMYNLTFAGSDSDGFDETDAAAIYLRRGAQGTFNNILAYNWGTGTVSGANTDLLTAAIGNKTLSMDGLLFFDNGKHSGKANTVAAQLIAAVAPLVGNGLRNFHAQDVKLRRPLEYSDPDFRPQPGSPVFSARWIQPPDDGFFDQWATWIGGMGLVNWTEEWTTFLQEEDIKP